MNYLGLCLIAKDEGTYLQEWLDYHILLGVEHFWIYDNESALPLADTLSDYINRGWVTLHTIKGRAMQLYAFDHCIQNYGTESKWIGFIDTDEFIVPHSPELLTTYLKRYEGYGGLAISSLFFGFDSNDTRPKCGQIAGYKTRTHERFSRNRLVKMIIQPEKVIYPISPHSFLFKENFFCVNEKMMRVDAQEFPCHVNSIQVNHYFSRSKQEWMDKLSRGGGAGVTYSGKRWLEINQYASVKDTLILDRLRKTLPHAPEESNAWEKITRRDSDELIKLLRQAADKIHPPHIKQIETEEVLPRNELKTYLTDMHLGMLHFDEGNLGESRNFWFSQITRFPFDPLRFTNFAVSCMQMGDYQSAWKAIAQAWRIAPQSLYVLLCMTDYFYSTGDFSKAEKTSLLAASQGDLEPVGIAILALSQWKQGKFQEAIATAQPVLSILKNIENKNPIFNELAALIGKKSDK
jgi:tetratricopeptide (TPR) repeat protein